MSPSTYRAREQFTERGESFSPGDVLPGPLEDWPRKGGGTSGRLQYRIPDELRTSARETGHPWVYAHQLPFVFRAAELEDLVARRLAWPPGEPPGAHVDNAHLDRLKADGVAVEESAG